MKSHDRDPSVRLSRRSALSAVLAGTGAITSAAGSSRAVEGMASPRQTSNLGEYEWSMFGGGRTLSGSTSLPGISSKDRSELSFNGIGNATQPVVSDGTVFIGGGSELLATALTPDADEWVYQGDERIIGAPAVSADTVVFVTGGGSITALNRETGEERWSFGLRGSPGIPSIADGTAYCGDNQGNVYAFDTTEGDVQWTRSFNINHGPTTNPHANVLTHPAVAVGPDLLYVNLSNDLAPSPNVVALRPDGSTNWNRSVGGDYLFPPAVTEQGVVVKTRGRVGMLSLSTGVKEWTSGFSEISYYPAAAGNGYAAIVEGPTCHLYDIQTGNQQWTYSVGEGTGTGGVTISGDMVYFVVATGARSGRLVAVGLSDGLERFSVDIGHGGTGGKYGPIPIPDGLFIPDGVTPRLIVNESFSSGGQTDTASTDQPSDQERSDSTEAAQSGDSADEASGTQEQLATEASRQEDYLDFSLSTVESIVVIVTSLLGGAYSLFRVLSRRQNDG